VEKKKLTDKRHESLLLVLVDGFVAGASRQFGLVEGALVVLAPELAEPDVAAVDALAVGVDRQRRRVRALVVVHPRTQTPVVFVKTCAHTFIIYQMSIHFRFVVRFYDY